MIEAGLTKYVIRDILPPLIYNALVEELGDPWAKVHVAVVPRPIPRQRDVERR